MQRAAFDSQLLDRRRPQRRDPIQPGRSQRRLDAGVGDHAAVSHQDHAFEVEALLQCLDLFWHGRRIAGVSLKHLDRNRAAVQGTQQTDDQLRAVTAMVAAVAELRQRTAAAFQVGGGDVVQHQHAFLQVAAGERGFDKGLLADQPVERGVEFAGGDAAEVEDLAQGMAGGGGIEHPRGGQLRRRVEQTGDNQAECQSAVPPAAPARQEIIETDLPGGGESRHDMAVRERATDFEAALAGRHHPVATQHGAQGLDLLGWPVGEIGQGTVEDLAVLAIALAQQDGGGRAPVGDGGDIHAPSDQTEL